MSKEKTLYSYQSEGFRLQLVCLEDVLRSYYQVRVNRERNLTTTDLSKAKHRFWAFCFQNLNQQSLF